MGTNWSIQGLSLPKKKSQGELSSQFLDQTERTVQ